MFNIVEQENWLNSPWPQDVQWEVSMSTDNILICSKNWIHAFFFFMKRHFLWIIKTSLVTFEMFTITTVWCLYFIHFSFFIVCAQGRPSVFCLFFIFFLIYFLLRFCVEHNHGRSSNFGCCEAKEAKKRWFMMFSVTWHLTIFFASFPFTRFLLDQPFNYKYVRSGIYVFFFPFFFLLFSVSFPYSGFTLIRAFTYMKFPFIFFSKSISLSLISTIDNHLGHISKGMPLCGLDGCGSGLWTYIEHW